MGNTQHQAQKREKVVLVAGFLDPVSQRALASFADSSHVNTFDPSFPEPNDEPHKRRCHHCTFQYKGSKLAAAGFAGLKWRGPVLGVFSDGDAVTADLGEIEVEVKPGFWCPIRSALDALAQVTGQGRMGQDWHVTISHSDKVAAVHSNEVLAMARGRGEDPNKVAVPLALPSDLNGLMVGGTMGWMSMKGQGLMRDHTTHTTIKGFVDKLAMAHGVGRSGVGSKPLPGLETNLLADLWSRGEGGPFLDLGPEARRRTAPGIMRRSEIPEGAVIEMHDHRGEMRECVVIGPDEQYPVTKGGLVILWKLGAVLADPDTYTESKGRVDEFGIPILMREAIDTGAVHHVVSLQANPWEGSKVVPRTPWKTTKVQSSGEEPYSEEELAYAEAFWSEHIHVYYKED